MKIESKKLKHRRVTKCDLDVAVARDVKIL